MSNILSSLTSFTKVVLVAGLLAAFPLIAMAEGTDLQQGSQGNIDQSTPKAKQPAPHGTSFYVEPQPSTEGTDLETGSKGDIATQTGGAAKSAEVDTSSSPVPEQQPDMEGTDLQKGAQTSIEE